MKTPAAADAGASAAISARSGPLLLDAAAHAGGAEAGNLEAVRLARSRGYPAPQHFLCFLPLPQGHGSLRPTLRGAPRPPREPRRRRPGAAARRVRARQRTGSRRPRERRRAGPARAAGSRRRSPRRRASAAAARQRELVDQLERLRVDARVHLLEQAEALALVLELRVALPVGAHADALAQAVHRVEVVLPLRVEDLQQDAALAVGEARVALLGVLLGERVAALLLALELAR